MFQMASLAVLSSRSACGSRWQRDAAVVNGLDRGATGGY